MGQLINFDKLLIYFSGNVGSDIQHQVGRILGVHILNNLERYLGLPTKVGHRKKMLLLTLNNVCQTVA